MDSLLALVFEAHNAPRNHHRRYEICVGRDLFDDWTVSIRYGRVGQRGQERRYGARAPEALRAIIRESLRRRLSAPRRIGCAYRMTSFTHVEELDTAAWLPADVLNRLLAAPHGDD